MATENRTCHDTDVVELVDDGVEVGEEVRRRRVAGDAEQLGELAGRDRQTDADLDAA